MPGVDGKGQNAPKGISPGESVEKNVRTDTPKGGSIKTEGPNAYKKGRD